MCSALQPREFQYLSRDLSRLSYGTLPQSVARYQMTMRLTIDNQLQTTQSLRGQSKLLSNVIIKRMRVVLVSEYALMIISILSVDTSNQYPRLLR